MKLETAYTHLEVSISLFLCPSFFFFFVFVMHSYRAPGRSNSSLSVTLWHQVAQGNFHVLIIGLSENCQRIYFVGNFPSKNAVFGFENSYSGKI